MNLSLLSTRHMYRFSAGNALRRSSAGLTTLLLTTALLGTNIALVQNVASAKSAAEVGQIATAITLEIKASNSSKAGSGILLQRQGNIYTVLTTAHVLSSGNSFQIKTADGTIYSASAGSVRRAGKNIDLAILRFQSNKNYIVATIGTANTMKIGSPSYVAGFPMSTYVAASGTLNFTEGKVIGKATKPNSDGYSLFYSNATLSGMSGGPVLDEQGQLVAIHGQGDRAGKEGRGEKTGRNLGITVESFSTVALAMGIKLDQPIVAQPASSAPSQPSLNAADYLLTAYEKYDRGDYQGALADYRRSVAIDPKLVETYDSSGVLKGALNGLLGIFENLTN